ncbi:MAG: SDR family NAD(P)-dependent oxidoreductase [Caulobacteraceae bacterium]
MNKPLTGQVALVTGASGGLGLRFARILAQNGAAVALAARRTELIEQEAEAIRSTGERAISVTLDVSDPAQIAPAMDEVEAAFGPISILINNAGVGGKGLLMDLSLEDWDQTMNVNLRAVFLCAREAARRMMANGVAGEKRGRIINIASVHSYAMLPGIGAYCASKAGVQMLTEIMAREWARSEIAVNAICPGYILTDINADWFDTDQGAKQLKGFPRRRLVEDEALDAALVMLAGPAAKFITGSSFTIDDGQMLRS